MLRPLLLLASLATVAVSLWLFTVILWVLPARDPSHLPMWTGVAFGFLVYGALSLAYLVLGSRRRWLRGIVLLLSLLAIGLGSYGVVRMIQATEGHFEGYLLLGGLVLAGHGVVAFAYTVVTGSIARRISVV